MDINTAKDRLYDLTHLHAITKGNDVLLRKILDTFVKQVSATVVDIESSFKMEKLEDVAMLAHSIKPNIDSLGIVSLMQVIRNIESDAKIQYAGRLATDIALLKSGMERVVIQLLENELN